MLLARVDLGRESELTTMGMDDGYVRREDGALVSAAGQILAVSGQGTDSLFIELPRVQKRGGAEVLRLSFTSTVYRSGSTFAVEVGNSQDPDNWQSVDPGEGVGDELAAGEGLTVLTPIDSQIIKSERITPIFTPNGDGINDHAQFEFSVLKINIASPVLITISDMSGRVVRTLREVRSQANGLYQIDWDGLNEHDQLVAPGIYVARIGVDTERITDAIHLVSVAY